MAKKAKHGYAPALPPIPPRRYNYKNTEDLPFGVPLPFEKLPKSYEEAGEFPACYWYVPRIDDYSLAVQIGQEYAAHFAQYLKDNPDGVSNNALGHTAASIDFEDESCAKGYWVGFFTHLGRYILAGVKDVDVFKDLDDCRAEEERILAESGDEDDDE